MNDTQDTMREIGELVDPVQEQLRKMLHEFGDEHYHTCPADDDSGPCDCFAGHLIVKARAALEAALISSPMPAEKMELADEIKRERAFYICSPQHMSLLERAEAALRAPATINECVCLNECLKLGLAFGARDGP